MKGTSFFGSTFLEYISVNLKYDLEAFLWETHTAVSLHKKRTTQILLTETQFSVFAPFRSERKIKKKTLSRSVVCQSAAYTKAHYKHAPVVARGHIFDAEMEDVGCVGREDDGTLRSHTDN